MNSTVADLLGSKEVSEWIQTHASRFRIKGAPYARPVFLEVEERGAAFCRKRFEYSRAGLRAALAWTSTQSGKTVALPSCVMCAQDFQGMKLQEVAVRV